MFVIIPEVNQSCRVQEWSLNSNIFLHIRPIPHRVRMYREGTPRSKLSLNGFNEHVILIHCLIENEPWMRNVPIVLPTLITFIYCLLLLRSVLLMLLWSFVISPLLVLVWLSNFDNGRQMIARLGQHICHDNCDGGQAHAQIKGRIPLDCHDEGRGETSNLTHTLRHHVDWAQILGRHSQLRNQIMKQNPASQRTNHRQESNNCERLWPVKQSCEASSQDCIGESKETHVCKLRHKVSIQEDGYDFGDSKDCAHEKGVPRHFFEIESQNEVNECVRGIGKNHCEECEKRAGLVRFRLLKIWVVFERICMCQCQQHILIHRSFFPIKGSFSNV